MKKSIIYLFAFFFVLFFGSCIFLYLQQEKLLFNSELLPKDFSYHWNEPFEEIFLKPDETSEINGVLFHVKNPKGVVLYFHGQGGNLYKPWGKRAKDFTKRGYDLFMIDYRGFGKSRGKLSEKMLLKDAESAYRFLMEKYPEENIIVYGRSLGTGIALYIASLFTPKSVILEAPYFSIFDIALKKYSFIPRFLISLMLKYPFRADLWIEKARSPIHMFHGTQDALIPYESSIKLYEKTRKMTNITFTTIEDANHDLFSYPEYQTSLSELLNQG